MYEYFKIQDQKFASIISWLPEENGFKIFNVSAFVENVLPSQFKHKNIASFVRQLNMYGFSRPLDSDQNVYIHQKFQKGNFNSLRFIKRRSGHPKHSQRQQSEQLGSSSEQHCSNKDQNNNYQFEKLISENKQLRRQNEELKRRLFKFEEVRKKIKLISQQMKNIIGQSFEETENERSEKQANSSDSTQSNSNNVGKSGFSYCKNNCQSNQNESYNLLIHGSQNSVLK